MPLFKIPERAGKPQDKAIIQKAKSGRKAPVSIKGDGLLGKLTQINSEVEKKLGKFKDDYIIIQDISILHDYFSKCLDNHIISIDTETTGLNPIEDKIVGLCIYTPDQPAAYVPINHISYITGIRVDEQLTEKEVCQEMDYLLTGNPDIIMFNACFDIRVIRNQLKCKDIYCTWDCYLAARILNENEITSGLKALHKKYVLNGKENTFSFDELFKGITFDNIPINTGYLYAAHDAIITYELYQYQKKFVYYDPSVTPESRNGMNGASWVFFNIEMPCIPVVADMEDTGILFDLDYQKELSVKYNILLEEKKQTFYKLCEEYKDKINDFRKGTADSSKLDDPINIASSTQLAILFYDILKCKSVDKKNPRGTGEAILSKLDNPLAKAVLEYRTLSKLVSTYIDKLPKCVNKRDGRIHCRFNQYGAHTGRFASQDPNLQNIPSHNKDIRKMFIASPGYVLMSSDFSQQEPKCLASLCKQQGDPQMYNTFMEGKDLYSEIASKSFNVPYEDCKEFREDGTTNKQGKERRTQAKSILLGVLYGRGEKSIAEQLNCTEKKAKAIKQSVFKGFPAIQKFEQDSLQMAQDIGYVTTVCGRKRRLPDLQLPEFEFTWKDGAPPDDDLLDFDDMNEPVYNETEVPEDVQDYYIRKLSKCWGSQKRKIFEEASNEGIIITDNGAKIADAQRQCVNARIQGSAADLTKLAMIDLNNNVRLKELGFRLLIPVHDEVIAECPETNAKECAKLLADTMCAAAEKILEMPIKCDVEITRQWYGERVEL